MMVFLGLALFFLAIYYWNQYRHNTADRNVFMTSLVISGFYLIWFITYCPSLSTIMIIWLMVYLYQNKPEWIDALKAVVDKKIDELNNSIEK